MSHIPSSAMPHAGPAEATQNNHGGAPAGSAPQPEEQGTGVGATIGAGASKIADYARENPKTAVAAGAAIVAGLAAAAIPLVRGRSSDEDKGQSASGRKTKKTA